MSRHLSKDSSYAILSGIRVQVNFATFFILNAKVLELMRFVVDAKHYTQSFLAEQRKSFCWRKGLQEVLGFVFKLVDFSVVIQKSICL